MQTVRRLASALGVAGQAAGVAAHALGLDGGTPLHGPWCVQVGVSDACDHRCAMCPYHPPGRAAPADGFGGAPPGVMSVARFGALLDELAALGSRYVDLVGRGEPLVHPHIERLVRLAHERGFRVTMTSNAARLTHERARALVDAGLDGFRHSLHAASPEAYARVHDGEPPEAFARSLEQVRHLASLARGRPAVTASFTLSRLNYAELPAMVDVAASVGAEGAHFQHVILPDGPSDLALDAPAFERLRALAAVASERAAAHGLETNLETLTAEPPPYLAGPLVEPVPCYVGSYFAVVLGNGSVLPCCQTQTAVGSLEADGGFAAVWRGERYRAFREAARALPAASPALASAECDRCYFREQNLALHNLLHPLARAGATRSERRASPMRLLRATGLVRRR